MDRTQFMEGFADNPQKAIGALQADIRNDPSNPDLRVLMFQVYCLTGQWVKAGSQLELLAKMGNSFELMCRTYASLIRCELLRADVFAGRVLPMALGEPTEWLALMMKALKFDVDGQPDLADQSRARALGAASAVAGTLAGEHFEWIADGDGRLGPVLEVIIDGKYFWAPFQHIASVLSDAPADLRDLVWMPAELTLVGGAPRPAFIPARYPGAENASDGRFLLARRTEWHNPRGDFWIGLGQRMFMTDHGEAALLDCREIKLG